jgi:hypothetical protein
MRVIVTVSTSTTALPAGVIAGILHFAINDSTGAAVATQDVATGITAEFDALSPGDYTATAIRMDSTGAALGSAVSGAFTIPAVTPADPAMPAATYEAPVSLSVSLS